MKAASLATLSLLGCGLIALVLVKQHWGQTAAPEPPADSLLGKPAVPPSQRERIRRFWELYRQAGEAQRQDQFAHAAGLYQKALEFDPNHEDSLYYLGNCYYKLSRFQDALQIYERLLSVNPEGSSRGYVRIGLLYACPDPHAPFDLNKAEEFFSKALQIDPDSGALLNLGEVALCQGKSQEAWDALLRLNADNVMHPAIPYLLGYVCWRQGRDQESWSWFQEALNRLEVKKPPVQWSEEGNVKVGPEYRWKALAEQSILSSHWMRLLTLHQNQAVTPSEMSREYHRLHQYLAGLPKQ